MLISHRGVVHLVEVRVEAVAVHELIVGTDLDDLPHVQHHDLVGAPDGGQPMGDYDGSSTLQELFEAQIG